MYQDLDYFNFNEKKDLVYYFFEIMFEEEKNRILKILDKYINFEGNGLNEEVFIVFSEALYKEDAEYFGKDKVAFYFYEPFLEEDCAVLTDYKQFYDSLVRIFKEYIDKFSEEEIKQINEKLNILKYKLQV